MEDLNYSIISTLLSTIVLTLIYLYLYIQDRDKALGLWAIAWSFYFIRALFMYQMTSLSASQHPVLLFGNQASALANGFFLLWGTYALQKKKLHISWAITSAAIIIWLLVSIISEYTFVFITMPGFIFLFIVYSWTGLTFLRFRGSNKISNFITGIALIVWGIHKIDYPFTRTLEWFAPIGYLIASTLAIIVAVGILIAYFEKIKHTLLKHENQLDSALLESITREVQISLLLNAAKSILENRNFKEIAESIFNSCKDLTNATSGFISIYSENGDIEELLTIDASGIHSGLETDIPASIEMIKEEVLKSGDVVYENNIRPDPLKKFETGFSDKVDNVLISPLVLEGKTAGLIGLINKQDSFTDNDAWITGAFTSLASISLMNSRSREMHFESESRFRTVVESMSDIVFTLDNNHRLTGIFGQWLYQEQVDINSFIGKTAIEIFGHNIGPDHIENYNKALKGELATYEWSIEHNNKTYHIQTSLSPMKNSVGEITGVVGVSRNITELKETEEKIEKSLKEKELLLKEIHHRVKNNMQIISSLINLQAGMINDEKYQHLFNETTNRVRAMALVHEKLYQSDDLSGIDFKEYINEFISSLLYSYDIDRSRIAINVFAENSHITIDKALPCAQILNELVSNSLKYAFPENRKGEIKISFIKDSNGQSTLQVIDNGIGLPEDFSMENSDTLGLQLISGLVKQLSGTISIINDNGTNCKIEFSE